MGADEDEIEGLLPAASGSEAAAALQLDLDDDEFADLALGDDEPAAADSGDALELDELDVMELEGHAAHEDVDEDEEEEGLPTLYLEVDGRFCPVEKEKFIIGRVSTMCDLAIRDVNVSRQHCVIERRGDGYYAVDLGSINGIVIDGKRTDNHRIREGEVLVLSGHEIAATFHAPMLTEPEGSAEEELAYPNLTGEFPPVPQAEPEPEIEPDPEPAPFRPAPAPVVQEPVMAAPMAMQVPLSFEQRVEQRLDYMAQQLAYLQQTINALYVRVEQLQGVAALADMIQGRLAHKNRDR
jgi:hypothetical protein